MFSGTVERQLDSKRRIVLPVEFRALVSGPFDGIVCFPSIESDCIEAGGQKLFESYQSLIAGFPMGDPLRTALEVTVLGGQARLSWDPAGRITLPETLCAQFGITDWVSIVGMGDRMQIWAKPAFDAYREQQRLFAREALAAHRLQQRAQQAAAS